MLLTPRSYIYAFSDIYLLSEIYVQRDMYRTVPTITINLGRDLIIDTLSENNPSNNKLMFLMIRALGPS